MNRRKFLETTIIGASGAISGVPGRLSASGPLQSRDGYIRHEADRWVIGNAKVEKVVTLKDGRLLLTSFKNKYSGRGYIQGGASSQEVRVTVDGREITGSSIGWVLTADDSHRLPQGELQLDLKLQNGAVEISKHYVLYPGSPVIREWMTVANISSQPVTLSDRAFLESRVMSADAENLDLYYLTGGCPSYSVQMLKKDKMSATYARTIDSYDPSDTGPRGMSYSAHPPGLGSAWQYRSGGISRKGQPGGYSRQGPRANGEG